MSNQQNIIITITCKDKPGLVFHITQAVFDHSLNIVELKEHVEKDSRAGANIGNDDTKVDYFFARLVCTVSNDMQKNTHQIIDSLKSRLISSLDTDGDIEIYQEQKKNIVVMVSHEYHCLSEIILRAKFDSLNANILAVIGNHDNNLKELCSIHKSEDDTSIPFHCVPSPQGIDRNEHEAQLLEVLRSYAHIDYIVMARYMRILSAEFIAEYAYKIINIHHSFLPAFIGANPYRQAHQRGVKLIGATAHFATDNLDEGPIIAQQVLPINQSDTIADLQKQGRDTEKLTLAHALDMVFADRVFIHKNKTIIL